MDNKSLPTRTSNEKAQMNNTKSTLSNNKIANNIPMPEVGSGGEAKIAKEKKQIEGGGYFSDLYNVGYLPNMLQRNDIGGIGNMNEMNKAMYPAQEPMYGKKKDMYSQMPGYDTQQATYPMQTMQPDMQQMQSQMPMMQQGMYPMQQMPDMYGNMTDMGMAAGMGTMGAGMDAGTGTAMGTGLPGCGMQSTLNDVMYTPGFLRTQIGRKVKVEFLIGTNMILDREGTLVSVGTSYIIIQETETDDYLLCDMYSIKFVKFFY